jgi:outer membrane biosynthesis protein TonB
MLRRDSYIYSGVLHVVAALLAVFGLPHFFRDPPPQETPMVVDLVPIGAKTNPPPKQADEPQPEPAKSEPPKPEPPKPEPPKPEPPKPAPPPPPKPPEPEPPPPPKPEPKPEPLPLPKPEAKPEPKPTPKPPEQKLSDMKPPPKPQPQTDVDSLLKTLEKPKPKNAIDDLLKSTKDAKPAPPTPTQGAQTRPQGVKGSDQHNPLEPVSQTEMDRIRAHVEKCWVPPAGAKEADKLVVAIRVFVQPDGSVSDAQIVDRPVFADSFWQAAADSARRAVRTCSPLPIPKDKFDTMKNGDLVLTFDVAKAMGRR